MRATRPTLTAAIEWIAFNDNPGDDESPETMAGYCTVALVADLFGKRPIDIAERVHRLRAGFRLTTRRPEI